MGIQAHRISVGVTQNAGRYYSPMVRLRFADDEAIFLDMEDAVLFHRRLGQFIAKHATATQKRAK